MFYILSAFKFKSSIKSVFEIGGGYGNPARLWLSNPIKDIDQYCILDLPETLFFAECFLRMTLPDVEILYLHQDLSIDLQISPAQGKKRIILCPLVSHKKLKNFSFDIAMNTGSMAEMTDDWIIFYKDLFDFIDVKVLYSHNYFANPIDQMFESRALMAPKVSSLWSLNYIRPMHPMMTLTSALRRAAELIFVKKSIPIGNRYGEITVERLLHKKIDMYSYIEYCYAVEDVDNVQLLIDVFFKICTDLGYIPVELLSVAIDIKSKPKFDQLDPEQKSYFVNKVDDMLVIHHASYPKGTHSD